MNLIPLIANYIARYAPSEKRIRQYLTKKNCHNIDTLLSDIHFDELLMGEMWMRTFVALGKGEQEIKLKLQKKEFSKEIIITLLQKFEEEVHDWESNRHAIENQIQTLESRGKSKQAIMNVLVSKYRYFRDEIRTLLEGSSDSLALSKEVDKYMIRYDITDPKEKQKFYSAIMRKGFAYDDIKSVLRKNETQEN